MVLGTIFSVGERRKRCAEPLFHRVVQKHFRMGGRVVNVPAKQSIPVQHVARRMKRPSWVFKCPVVLGAVAGHRSRDPVRCVVRPTATRGYKMVDRGGELPVGRMCNIHLPVGVVRKVLWQRYRNGAMDWREYNPGSGVAVVETITNEHARSLSGPVAPRGCQRASEWIGAA